jgi:lysophospholipase L1-like esterase
VPRRLLPIGARPMKDLIRNIVLGAASLALFWAAVEGGLRLAGFVPERTVNPNFDWGTRGEFWRFKPGSRWKTDVGGHQVSINSYGLRGREVGPPEPGTLRVLVLGDSVTFGHGVAEDDTFVRKLEIQREGREPPIEVVNAGIPGWSTRQQRIFYERHSAGIAPDLVLVGFVLNDFTEIHRGLVRLDPGREVALFRTLGWLARRSAVVASAKRGYETLRSPEQREIHEIRELATRSESPEVQRAMDQTIDELRSLAGLVRARGEEFGVVVFPFRFQLLEEGLEAPQRRLRGFAEAEGVAFLDTLPLLSGYPAGEVLLDHDHFTSVGHALVAEALSEWIDRESLLPLKRPSR